MSSPLPSHDLYAMASVVSICCQKATDTFNETKRVKKHPSETADIRDNLMNCVDNVHAGMNTTCKELYETLKDCQSKGKWSNCLAIQAELEKCAVKNKLGELA